MIYFYLLLLLIFVSAFTLYAKKINMIPISVQMIATIVAVLLAHNTIDFNSVKENIRWFYDINFVIILYFILTEIKHLETNQIVVKIATISFLVPFILGFGLAGIYFADLPQKNLVLVGLLFSITAVPVLFFYLKGYNYSPETIKKYLSIAILIDLISWITFSIINNNLTFMNMLLIVVLGLIPIWLSIIKVKNNYILGIILLAVLLFAEFNKLNVLLIGVIYVMSLKLISQEVDLPIKNEFVCNYQTYIAIPVVLLYGFLQINIQDTVSWNDGLIILLAILIKIISNLIGLALENERKFKEVFKDAIFLNVRGLTEIVFLNMIYNLGYINARVYVIFVIVSMISNILPILYKKN